jgi:hypothetical protein
MWKRRLRWLGHVEKKITMVRTSGKKDYDGYVMWKGRGRWLGHVERKITMVRTCGKKDYDG